MAPIAEGHWYSDSIAGHSCDVFEPARRHPQNYVVLYLHGVHLNRLIDKPAFTTEFERHGLVVVAPYGGRCWWTDRICRDFDATLTPERHVLQNVLPYIQERFGAAPPKIGLLGTSMGGQGALRYAYRYPNQFPVVAAISPAIDFHLRIDEGDEILAEVYGDPEAARQDTAILHIHPLNWPRHQFFCCDPADERWWDSVDRLRMKLYSLGVPFESDLQTTGGGHGFQYYSLMAPKAINFIVERLERERLRLPTV